MEQVIVGGLAVLFAPVSNFGVSRGKARMVIRRKRTWKIGIQRNVFYQFHARREPGTEVNQGTG